SISVKPRRRIRVSPTKEGGRTASGDDPVPTDLPRHAEDRPSPGKRTAGAHRRRVLGTETWDIQGTAIRGARVTQQHMLHPPPGRVNKSAAALKFQPKRAGIATGCGISRAGAGEGWGEGAPAGGRSGPGRDGVAVVAGGARDRDPAPPRPDGDS